MKIERRKPLHAVIGVLGVGHHTYWAQFEGLPAESSYRLQKVGGDILAMVN